MSLWKTQDYKEFTRERIASLPKGGHGQMRRLAEQLRMHTSLVSQILRGPKHFTPEQALGAAEFLALTPLETDAYVTLVELERAGTAKLRALLRQRLEVLRSKAQILAERLPQDRSLSETEQAIFYSSWMYSALRLGSSLEGMGNAAALSRLFGLEPAQAARIVEFLVGAGLCRQDASGRLSMGPQRTHLSAGSPLVRMHHRNWRVKAMERHDRLTEEELAFTAPVTLSAEDFAWFREKLLQAIQELSVRVEHTKAERFACLNIDWVAFL